MTRISSFTPADLERERIRVISVLSNPGLVMELAGYRFADRPRAVSRLNRPIPGPRSTERRLD
jgi:hypothetical protein